MIWVVVANSNDCRFYSYNRHAQQIQLMKEISEPENKLKKSEYLTTDRPGHYQAGSIHGAYSPHSDAKEVEFDNFARVIAKELNHSRNTHEYDQLILISPPHMYGLLNKHLDKHIKELVINDLQKDLIHLNDKEILDYIHKNI